MKTIVAIVLVGLLGFLGCSGDDNDTNTIGEATPVAPFGITETMTPTYEWTPVPWATKYRLVVQDTNEASTIQDAQETYTIDEWYTAEESGCASEDGLCEATPDAEVIGKNEFKVQACENENCGLWSEALRFELTPPGSTDAPRFTDNGDGTVTDNNTRLTWTKYQTQYSQYSEWNLVEAACRLSAWPCKTFWHIPSLSQWHSLLDKTQSNPALPEGHPFEDVELYYYWTNNGRGGGTDYAWAVDLRDGRSILRNKIDSANAWCVCSHN